MRQKPCILTTVCLPLDEGFRLMEGTFRKCVQHMLASGFENLYVFGTAGEGYGIDDRMFRQVAGIFFEEMRPSKGICQLGIIGLSVPQVEERIRTGLEIGYRSFQISLPSWGRLNETETQDYFDRILGSFRQAEFLHYNVSRGLRALTGSDYARIVARHPNLVATKCGGRNMGDDLDLISAAPELCHYFTELDFAYASQFHPCGLLAGYVTMNPPLARRLFEAGQRRDLGSLVELTPLLYRVLNLVVGAPAGRKHMDGVYDKLYFKAAIPSFPLRLIPPYEGASDEEFELLMSRLAREVPGWPGR